MHTPPCRFVIAPDVNIGVVMTLLAPDKGSGQGRIPCCVSDMGIGIPQGKLETMFQTFVRLESFSSRKYQGAGPGSDRCA